MSAPETFLMAASRDGTTRQRRFDQAFASSEPLWDLRVVVRGLFADGHDREQILGDLEQVRVVLKAADRDQDEDTVLAVMDFVAGWCRPHMRL